MTQTARPHATRPGRPVRPAGDLYALPTVVGLREAAMFLGIADDTAYGLARSGRFPVPVLRVGKQYRVTRAALLTALDPDGIAAPKGFEPPTITNGEAAALTRVRAASKVPNVAPAPGDVGVLLAVLDRFTAR